MFFVIFLKYTIKILIIKYNDYNNIDIIHDK